MCERKNLPYYCQFFSHLVGHYGLTLTNKSSCFLKNSVSEASGSQSKSCSTAISFRRFSFFSGEGARIESSSINCNWNLHGECQTRKWLFVENVLSKKKRKRLYSMKISWTWRLTPQSGLSSVVADKNSFPYLAANSIWTCNNSGKSAHLGAAKHTLDMASFKSRGHSLNNIEKIDT